MVGIEKDGWRAEPLPEDLPAEEAARSIGALCTYCEQVGYKVFLEVEIDARMKPVWCCARQEHRFPHSDDLVRIAGPRFAELLVETLQRRRL